mmetsp:Transcript_7856/g.21674  ORF Transcript_7856/g.21674 Transcript_7856/m.21674 type:complete len:230 (-) Transcript_7856:1195-1884(-)
MRSSRVSSARLCLASSSRCRSCLARSASSSSRCAPSSRALILFARSISSCMRASLARSCLSLISSEISIGVLFFRSGDMSLAWIGFFPPRFMSLVAISCLGANISLQSFFAAHGLESLVDVLVLDSFDSLASSSLTDPVGVVARVDASIPEPASPSSSSDPSPSIAGNSSPSSSAHLPTDPRDSRGGRAVAKAAGLGMLGGLPEVACAAGGGGLAASERCADSFETRDV